MSLIAGQRYQIRMEFYEQGGLATARLLWSSPSTPKEVGPATRLYAPALTGLRINFQPASTSIPPTYLADVGLAFADRGNGQSYGWNADNTAQMRDRDAANAFDQRYDTLAYMQKPANPDAVWEIALPNGTYDLELVGGDPTIFGNTMAIAAEGVLALSGTTTSAQRWLRGSATVTVADGRLTISNAPGANGNKICFVVITQR
jgi:hypothetical protein